MAVRVPVSGRVRSGPVKQEWKFECFPQRTRTPHWFADVAGWVRRWKFTVCDMLSRNGHFSVQPNIQIISSTPKQQNFIGFRYTIFRLLNWTQLNFGVGVCHSEMLTELLVNLICSKPNLPDHPDWSRLHIIRMLDIQHTKIIYNGLI